MRTFFSLATLLFLMTLPATAQDADALEVRSLPSLRIAWQHPGRTLSLVVDDGVVYAVGWNHLGAFDAATGNLLWASLFDESGRVFDPRPLLLGDRIAVAVGGELRLLDRASGAPLASQRPAGRLERLVGPPLAVQTEDGGVRRLFLFDREGGEVSSYILDGSVQALMARDGLVLLALLRPGTDEREAGYVVRAFGPRGGGPVYETVVSELTDLRLLEGRIVVRSWNGKNMLLWPFDLQTGELGDLLPRLETAPEGFTGAGMANDTVWFSDQTDKPRSIARRLDPVSGATLWEREVPGRRGADVKADGFLYVHTRPRYDEGRGVLYRLDESDGTREALAYGLRDVTALAAEGDLLIAATSEGLFAFSRTDFGPPERWTRTVESEVERLMEPVERRNDPDSGAAAELLTLGEEVLPILVERLPHLTTAGVLVAARVLGEKRYRPAAPVLQAVLERGLTPIPYQHAREGAHEAEILHALGRVGGDAQVELIGRYLDDLSTDRRFVIREALLALGEIGGKAAAAEVERRLGRSWPAWTTHVTVPDDPGTDTDGDGASDAVERLLGLDPQKADMDGDGIADGADPSPNATDGRARGEEEEILRTIIESYLLSGDMYDDPKVVVVLADSAVEMRHPRGGVILTIDEAGFAAYKERLGNSWALGLRIERGEVASHPFADVWHDKTVPNRLAKLEADERLYVLTKLHLEGILVVVRRTGEGWLVRTLDTWWMS